MYCLLGGVAHLGQGSLLSGGAPLGFLALGRQQEPLNQSVFPLVEFYKLGRDTKKISKEIDTFPKYVLAECPDLGFGKMRGTCVHRAFRIWVLVLAWTQTC